MDTDVLEDVNIEINKGEIVGVVGESGSGKSSDGAFNSRVIR